MSDPSKHIVEALRLVRHMIILAEDGDAEAVDDGCRILFASVRDCAYRIRAEAEREREAHKKMGIWEETHTPEIDTELS